MSFTIRLINLINATSVMLIVAHVTLAQPHWEAGKPNSPSGDSQQEQHPDTQISLFEADSVRDASLGVRIKEAAELYFLPKKFRSLVSLYGYRFSDVVEICNSPNPLSKDLPIGRIAAINESPDSATREIIVKTPNTDTQKSSHYTKPDHTLSELCESLLNNTQSTSRMKIIAIEKPLPLRDVMPSHRYILNADSLAK